ncbi:oxidoreductase [Microthyrium microscopicum]|uniref:D-arabinitol 2-dehydrogenase [ribulose-forming] n=1 Tax=Microthyrium microscopicum TaxID=703497 RepID=A0A6A6U1L6_9PEZI|nr:oxidoreductase [Microthyrium microscopicum]
MADQSQITSRDELTNRIIPQMTLSDGSATSLTAPPIKEAVTDHQVAAQQRFAIKGTAIVTGGTGTLGLQAATALLQHGLNKLMLFDLNTSSCQDIISLLREQFRDSRIEALDVDITDDVAIAQAVAKTVELFDTVDILLNFAGVVNTNHALDIPIAQFRRVLDINTTGGFICSQAVARQMVHQGTGGSIVFVASISGHRVNFPQPQIAYNVSKAAVLAMKNCLAAEWARYGIRTNSISPGYMDTILNEGAGLEECRQIWTSRNPSGRMGLPSELTGAILLLASDAGSYINGADIPVDGGQMVF